MAIDTQAPISRRGLLAAALGGTAAAVAGAITTAERVLGAGSDGETVVIGGDYLDVRTPTTFRRSEKPILILERRSVGAAMTLSGDEIMMALEELKGTTVTRIKPGKIEVDRVESEDVVAQEIAVSGATGNEIGVDAEAPTTAIKGIGGTTGVVGGSPDGKGVRGWGKRGGSFSGKKAAVRLVPSDKGTHPARGQRGDLFVDKDGNLWFCKGNTRWRQLA